MVSEVLLLLENFCTPYNVAREVLLLAFLFRYKWKSTFRDSQTWGYVLIQQILQDCFDVQHLSIYQYLGDEVNETPDPKLQLHFHRPHHLAVPQVRQI